MSCPDFWDRPPFEKESRSQAGSAEAPKSPPLLARCTSSFAQQASQCLGQTDSGILYTIMAPYLSLPSPSLPQSSENSRSSPWKLQRRWALVGTPQSAFPTVCLLPSQPPLTTVPDAYARGQALCTATPPTHDALTGSPTAHYAGRISYLHSQTRKQVARDWVLTPVSLC